MHLAIPLIVWVALVPACKKASSPAAQPPSPPAAVEYSMCGGQKLAAAAAPPRRGPVTVQLAPAFLDEMTACRAETALAADLVARSGEGVINAKGDCEFASTGVSCHFHAGAEFISASTTQQTPGQGELHCIVPGADPKSPSVYGGHVVCRGAERAAPKAGHAAGHDVKAGARCSSEILAQVRTCQTFRCCDDGTLTNPIADLVRDGRNDVRPDFRICSDQIVIDCALLANLTPHDANSPALGGVGAPVFGGGR